MVMSALVALAGCAVGDKAGGAGGVTTLRLASSDAQGRPASAQAERFAREVRRRSGGALRIKIVWEANVHAQGGYNAGWDQATAELVRRGTFDLGLVPARAWDTFGVTSMQALQAPLLIDSDALAATVARDRTVGEMLDGLRSAGVIGLGLLPEELRHPVGFGRALRSPRDFRGATLRVPRSRASYALARALGARPVDLGAPEFTRAIEAGRVAGAESGPAYLTSTSGMPEMTANVALYAKFNTLVANASRFTALSGHQRAILGAAAIATRDETLRAMPARDQVLAHTCHEGVSIVAAAPADIAALTRAARPVASRLDRDPLTRRLVARFEALKAGAPRPSAVRPCTPRRVAVQPAASGAPRDPSVLNGVYRYGVSLQAMLDAGDERGDAVRNYGLQTMTLRDGVFTSLSQSKDAEARCVGRYTLAGATMAVSIDRGGCFDQVRLEWMRTAQGLRIGAVVPLPPLDTPMQRAVEPVIWGAGTLWRRIGDPH
jgi:TRAP-type C4-dicarboxylate transport system substrate-binding protein